MLRFFRQRAYKKTMSPDPIDVAIERGTLATTHVPARRPSSGLVKLARQFMEQSRREGFGVGTADARLGEICFHSHTDISEEVVVEADDLRVVVVGRGIG